MHLQLISINSFHRSFIGYLHIRFTYIIFNYIKSILFFASNFSAFIKSFFSTTPFLSSDFFWFLWIFLDLFGFFGIFRDFLDFWDFLDFFWILGIFGNFLGFFRKNMRVYEDFFELTTPRRHPLVMLLLFNCLYKMLPQHNEHITTHHCTWKQCWTLCLNIKHIMHSSDITELPSHLRWVNLGKRLHTWV